MSRSEKLPAIQFYVGDWRKDVGVQSLDFRDRGIWFEVICLMHESEDRGRLVLNGEPMPDPAVARLLGLQVDEWREVRGRLLDYGVASEDDDGALVNRRMVKDEEIRRKRAEAGAKGGRRSRASREAKGQQKPSKAGSKPEGRGAAPDKDERATSPSKTEANPKQKDTPSVSSSASATPSSPDGDTSPGSPGGAGIDRLVAFVGEEHRPTVEAVADFPGTSAAWAAGVLAQYGPGELHDREANAIPEADRPRVLGLALQRMLTDGTSWSSKFFREIVLTAAKSQKRRGDRKVGPGGIILTA